MNEDIPQDSPEPQPQKSLQPMTEMNGDKLLAFLQTAVDGYSQGLQVQHMKNERDFETQTSTIDLQRHAFDKNWKLENDQFRVRALLCVLIFCFAAAMAFWSNRIEVALALLPTIIALLNWPRRKDTNS